MALQVLIESSNGKIEISKDKNNNLHFEGVFATYGKKNMNGRIYPKKVMEKAIKEYNENFIIRRKGCGETDHPEEASVSLKNIGFIIEEPLTLKETGKDSGEVMGKARILHELPMGHILYTLAKEGIVYGMSSRGLGEINSKKIMDEELGEEIEINEVSDYSLACFDAVSEPSTGNFVSYIKQQEEAINKPEEKKVIEKAEHILNSGDLVSLSEILFGGE